MYCFLNKNIGVTEYNKTSVTTPHMHPQIINNHNDMGFSSVKLYYAMARTNSLRLINNRLLFYDFLAGLLGFSGIIDEDDENFRLFKNRINKFRDFSKTARIGELGQAISYIFAQDILHRPIIIDFHAFCQRRHIHVPGNIKTPDFILHDGGRNNNIALMEVKSKYGRRICTMKSELKRAIAQCDQVIPILNPTYNVTNRYGVGTLLYDEQNEHNSKIYFTDPIESQNNIVPTSHIIKHYFASWFLLIGDENSYKQLIDDEPFNLDTNYLHKEAIGNETFYTISFEEVLFRYWSMLEDDFGNFLEIIDILLTKGNRRIYQNMKFGISERIINILKMDEQIEGIKFPEFESIDNKILCQFIDGTILKLKD